MVEVNNMKIHLSVAMCVIWLSGCSGTSSVSSSGGGEIPMKKDVIQIVVDILSNETKYTSEVIDGTGGGNEAKQGKEDVWDKVGEDKVEDICKKGIVKGMICNPKTKEFVNGATVTIETKDCEGKPIKIISTTDAQGFFAMQDVPEGQQELVVEWDGNKLIHKIFVVADQVNDVSPVTMAGCEDTDRCLFGDIKGTVCWKDGMPKAPVTKVYVKTVDCDGNPVYVETTTDEKGVFILLKVPEGKQTINVENAKVKEKYEVDVFPDAVTDVGFLGPADCSCHFGSVRGQVCWTANMPGVGNTKVFVDTVDCEGEKIYVETLTDAEGKFKLMGVPEGNQTIHVKNSKVDLTYPVVVMKDQINDVGFLGPKKCECEFGDLKGKVCWTAGMPQAPWTKVYIDTKDCFGAKVYLETFVDGFGYFTFTNVPAGKQVVHIENAKTNASYIVTIEPNKLNDVGLLGPEKCCGEGKVCGYACTPSGTWVGGAHVWVETIDCSGKMVKLETYTDSSGNYCLDHVPDGNQVVHVEKGQFSTSYTIQIKDGETIKAQDIVSNEELCFPKAKVKIAVVTGEWDTIQNIIAKLGFAYDQYDGQWNYQEAVGLLSNLSKMKEYDIIFFNCGANHDVIISSNPTITSNIQKYVQGGGSIYASDWAFVYVEYPFPSYIDYAGKIGASGTRNGTVVDGALVQALGKNKVAINYNLGAWVVVQGVSGQTVKHIIGPTPEVGGDQPWMMSFIPFPGGGKVLYTSFHNEQQLTLDMQKILEALVFVL